jgi:hypothetical protein
VAVLLTFQPPNRLTAQTIDTLIIQNGNVFTVDDGAPPFVVRLANSLHMKTRQWVIRRRVLLRPGDVYDPALAEESERVLRGLGVFRDVRVDTVRLGNRLALRVRTADGWSSQPQASYTTAGGDEVWEIGFVERNFFGTATEVAIGYGRTPDRRRLEFRFLNPHFLSRRALLMLRHGDYSDGRRTAWQFGMPFTELSARRSVVTYGESVRERVLRFRDGALADSSRRRMLRVGLVGGIAPHATPREYVRLWASAEWRRENFAPTDSAPFPYSVFTTVRAGVDWGRVRFRVLEQFNSYARREDVDLSPALRLGVVVQSGVGYEAHGQVSAVWSRGFAVLRAEANGLDTTRTRAFFTVVSQNIPRHTLIAHVEGGMLDRPKPGAEYDLWLEQRGPRLFGVHDFTGTRMFWLVLEDRILLADDILGLMGAGIAPFFDYGGAWYGDQSARLGGDAGLALRFGPTRAVRGEAAEIAVGYRFGQGAERGWGITLRKGVVF